MYVLDTNIIRKAFHESLTHPHLVRKIEDADQRDLYISVVTAEELMLWRYGEIHAATKAKSPKVVRAYGNFFEIINDLKRLQILPFDEAAYQEFLKLAPFQTTIGTNDRRIAATALSRGYTAITINTRHFEIIPGLKVEDWSIAPPEEGAAEATAEPPPA